MGQEDEATPRERAFAAYRVDDELMGIAAPGAVFLHCLPAHRGLEVTGSVIDSRASAVWDQAENRLHSARGLFLWLAGVNPFPERARRPGDRAAGPPAAAGGRS